MKEQVFLAYTVAAAAKELDVTSQSINRWLSEGRLVRYEGVQGGPRLVTTESVLAEKARAIEGMRDELKRVRDHQGQST